ncbi:YqaH family protein [Bacillus safensis]|uniref:Uncharacterized protein n=1 Tax=Bacillus safensis TaxID=561879 RepID=A0A1L6ZD87_BACIA|nr:YqaH family protein [Bacillus safensis]APT44474.1 hypothetical protein BSA145_00150 [Bacillus safensis]
MNLNNFLKTDREKADRLIKSTQFLVNELLSGAIKDQDFDGCIEIAGSVISSCEDLKRMEIPSDKLIDLQSITTRLITKEYSIETIKKPISGN